MKTKTQIIDGHPRTTNIIQDPKTGECIESEDNELLSDLPEIVQKFVVLWIAMKIHERKTPNYGSTSYGLKHILENEFGIYLTNNQFKDAMYVTGHYPVNEKDLNWYFRIDDVVNNRPVYQSEFMKHIIKQCCEETNKEEE